MANRIGKAGSLAGILVPIAGTSDFKVVAAAETDFDTTLTATGVYLFTCDIDCYIKQGAAPVAASAGDGSLFVPAGIPVVIDGAQGAKVSVIRKGSSDGVATLHSLKILDGDK